ncbi:MAG: acyl-CoA dehydrogenase family protein [Acidimicrobiales bacterium]
MFEELGRGLVPGPLVWTHLGSTLELDPGRIVGGVDGRATVGSGGRLVRGAPVIVEHLADLDDLLVITDDGITRVDPAELEGRQVEPLDPLTPVWVVDDLPVGERIGDGRESARVRLEGTALVAAQLSGMASALVELTVAYTLGRHQFGRPVGSFQALKHLMADMLTRAELARTQAYAAAAWLDDPSLGSPVRAVSAAKVVAGDAAIRNGRDSIQAHGGMGYTWEVDAHLYLKRAWVLDPIFGSADEHAEAMAANLR